MSEAQQPVAYVISAVEGFVDETAVKRYAELTGPSIKQFGGRFLVSNAETIVVEGVLASNRLSMVEFPSMEVARAWYDSLEYAEARVLTSATFKGRLLLFVDGNGTNETTTDSNFLTDTNEVLRTTFIT